MSGKIEKVVIDVEQWKLITDLLSTIQIPMHNCKQYVKVVDAVQSAKLMELNIEDNGKVSEDK